MLRWVRYRQLKACATSRILDEYAEVLSRKKFGFARERMTPLLDFLRAECTLIEAGQSTVQSPDPGDTKFIACALVSGASYPVTGNRRHFPASFYGAAKVLNAAELPRRLKPAQ